MVKRLRSIFLKKPYKSKSFNNSLGFTLVELMVVVGILAILIGLITINLSRAQHTASINTTIQTLISDLNSQKIKAMVGDSTGESAAGPYGLHFEADKYVLFYGLAYSSSSPRNFEIPLSPNLQFTSLIDVIFLQTSGELSSPLNIVLRDVNNNEEKTIYLNIYGVVTQVN